MEVDKNFEEQPRTGSMATADPSASLLDALMPIYEFGHFPLGDSVRNLSFSNDPAAVSQQYRLQVIERSAHIRQVIQWTRSVATGRRLEQSSVHAASPQLQQVLLKLCQSAQQVTRKELARAIHPGSTDEAISVRRSHRNRYFECSVIVALIKYFGYVADNVLHLSLLPDAQLLPDSADASVLVQYILCDDVNPDTPLPSHRCLEFYKDPPHPSLLAATHPERTWVVNLRLLGHNKSVKYCMPLPFFNEVSKRRNETNILSYPYTRAFATEEQVHMNLLRAMYKTLLKKAQCMNVEHLTVCQVIREDVLQAMLAEPNLPLSCTGTPDLDMDAVAGGNGGCSTPAVQYYPKSMIGFYFAPPALVGLTTGSGPTVVGQTKFSRALTFEEACERARSLPPLAPNNQPNPLCRMSFITIAPSHNVLPLWIAGELINPNVELRFHDEKRGMLRPCAFLEALSQTPPVISPDGVDPNVGRLAASARPSTERDTARRTISDTILQAMSLMAPI